MTGPDDERPQTPEGDGESAGVGNEVGSAAEEAFKLFGALADWARDQGGEFGAGVASAAGQAAQAVREVDEHVATSDPECRYCPVCRTVHLVRQTAPEVRAHLATAASSLMQAAAAALATSVPPEGRPNSSSTVERIDLDGEDAPGERQPGNRHPDQTEPEEDR